MLDACDIERILPYYFFDYRKTLRIKKRAENDDSENEAIYDKDVVVRNGKKYRKVNADEVDWANKIF